MWQTRTQNITSRIALWHFILSGRDARGLKAWYFYTNSLDAGFRKTDKGMTLYTIDARCKISKGRGSVLTRSMRDFG